MNPNVLLFIALSISFALLLWWIQKGTRTNIEPFQSNEMTLAKRFRFRVGVWRDPDSTSSVEFVDYLATLLPVERVDYEDPFRMYYDLREKAIDMVFGSERDYMIYWTNRSEAEGSILDMFRKQNEIQALCSMYNRYYYLVADTKRVRRASDLEGRVVQISPEANLGTELETELISSFNPHIQNRKGDVDSNGFQRIGRGVDAMIYIGDYPDTRLSERSNQQDIYLMDITSLPKAEEVFRKYLYLNKRTIDLRLYPYIMQRWNAVNRTGSLLVDGSSRLNTFSTRMMLLCNSDLNEEWAEDFMRILYNSLDDIRRDLSFANNFYNRDIAMSRLCMDPNILEVHPGARAFFRRIGVYSLNPDESCRGLNKECTEDEVARYGDYAKYYN